MTEAEQSSVTSIDDGGEEITQGAPAQLCLSVLVRVEPVKGEHLRGGHVQPSPGLRVGLGQLAVVPLVVRSQQRHLLLLLVHLEEGGFLLVDHSGVCHTEDHFHFAHSAVVFGFRDFLDEGGGRGRGTPRQDGGEVEGGLHLARPLLLALLRVPGQAGPGTAHPPARLFLCKECCSSAVLDS